MMNAIVLASKSPRRRQLMQLVLKSFEVDEAGLDESKISAESPMLLAQALAKAKAADVKARRPQDIIIGCDTVVELDGAVLGKPKNRQHAEEMLYALSGKKHLVHTGVCILANGCETAFAETTSVWFSSVPMQEIVKYVQTNEPYDKAGGYGVQGWASRFIPRIDGCYYNVMGLPVAALYTALNETGVLPLE